MKSERLHYVVLFLVIGIASWSLYFRIAFDGWITVNVEEPYYLKRMLRYLVDLGSTEANLKLIAASTPLAAGYVHRYYTDKKINLKLTIGLFVIGALSIAYPYDRLVHLPVFIGMAITVIGYFIYLRSILSISTWYFSRRLANDQFNTKNQSFPQTKRRMSGRYVFSLAYDFYNDSKKQLGYINIVNIFRSIFVWGTMGSGKTFSFISPIIYELIKLRFSLLVYDLKYPSLSLKTYSYFKKLKPKGVRFFQICTTNIIYSHRCNPVAPRYIPTITEIENNCNNVLSNLKRPDETESAFFKGTATGVFVALVALSKEMELKHNIPVCSMPHVSILASVKIDYLLPILLSKRELIMKVSNLRDSFDRGSGLEQLVGVTATLQEKLSRLYHLDAYYIFSGPGDFSLDLNSPGNEKIVTVGCDKDKTDVMSPYLSLVVETGGKEANKPNKSPFAAILDELSSFFWGGLVDFLESGRENLCALVVGVQGIEQLDKKYPKAHANSIIGIQGSVICGMGGTKTAAEISKRIGKTNQKRTGLNQRLEGDQTLNHSFFREDLIPVDRIGNFTQGEFCGVIADSLENPIEQKRFWGKLRKHVCHDVPLEKEMKVIHNFWNDDSKEVFRKHWEDMIDQDFFIEFQNALEKDEFIFVPKTVNYYNKYLKLSNEDIQLLRQKLKDFKSKLKSGASNFTFEKYLAEFFSGKLASTIVENEKHQFLTEYLNQMYDDIEFWVRKEYQRITGQKIDDDLFNLSDFKHDDLEEVPF